MISAYDPSHADDIADLFHAAVHAIDDALYIPAQKQAWAPTPPDYAVWRQRLNRTHPWVVQQAGCVVAFIEWEPGGHIDCFYTHPAWQGRGYGLQLYRHVEALAVCQGVKRLYVEASKVARPFFERQGFVLQAENRVMRQGVELINYTMEKPL